MRVVTAGAVLLATLAAAPPLAWADDPLAGLAKPQEERSMRATSTMRLGEVRRGNATRKLNPQADPKGDLEEARNYDNHSVAPGRTHVLLDEKGPGVITHIWLTFLGPETQPWAPKGSANHQEMLLRIYWDDSRRPAVEAPLGDFFANCFGRRSEVISLPVIVEDADSYNCFWHMPFRKSARIEIENQSDKPISLVYYKSTSWNEREDDYASVAFWYQTGESTFAACAPHAQQRALPCLDRVVAYARDFAGDKHHGAGSATTQQLDLYPGKQLLYQPPQAEGAWLEIPFEVTKKEPLRLLLNATKSYDFGMYQAYLNGIKLGGAIDLYSPKVVDTEVHLLDVWPDPGRYTLRLQCVGKNAQSDGYYCGLESVRLRERRPRVAEMGHDKNKDWRKDPKLYR